MAVQPQGVRRIVTGAALAAAVATVLVGVGVGVGTADEPAAPVPLAARPVPSVPQVVPRAGVRAPAPAAAPTATSAEDDPPAEVEADEPAEDDTDGSRDDAPTGTRPDGEPAAASVPVRAPTAGPALVAGTPCTAAAKACVDLDERTAWLIEGGAVRRGPVPVQIGDEIDPTPLGTFAVEWKAEQWTSREYLTQMPYSVFFAEGGIAFHEGAQDTNSAGCVKLVHADAVAFFEYLQVGDQVQIR